MAVGLQQFNWAPGYTVTMTREDHEEMFWKSKNHGLYREAPFTHFDYLVARWPEEWKQFVAFTLTQRPLWLGKRGE